MFMLKIKRNRKVGEAVLQSKLAGVGRMSDSIPTRDQWSQRLDPTKKTARDWLRPQRRRIKKRSSPSRRDDFLSLLENAERAGRAYLKSQTTTRMQLHRTLREVYALGIKCEADSEAKLAFKKKYEEILPWPKTGANPLYAYVKFALPADRSSTSNTHRFAAGLRAAQRRNVRPERLLGFFERNGGVTGCARLDFEQSGSGLGSSGTDRAKTKLEKLTSAACSLTSDELRAALPTDGLASLLVLRVSKNRILLLSTRSEKVTAVSRYPLKR